MMYYVNKKFESGSVLIKQILQDYVRAIREMDGKYVGNRPIKLRKSQWKNRQLEVGIFAYLNLSESNLPESLYSDCCVLIY